ncbi:MAG: hypothetical protein ACT4UQ_09310 [Gammaproteobacteria bacterium]
MPQVIPAIPAVLGYAVGTITVGQLVATILVNVALGSFEFVDEDGERWVADG